MDAERYQQIRTLFRRACELEPADREAFLGSLDEADRASVAELLNGRRIDTGALTPDLALAEEYELPHEFGPYRLVEKLGEGGMGIVYAAEDRRLGRRVAIKTIRRGMTGATARQRLLREARTAAGINHPLVCQVLEVGEQEGELFVAMELLEGESLEERLARGALPFDEALALLGEVLAALDVLHARGIVHRDLKPSNVFLTPHGIKLLDFGLARSFEGVTAERVTQTGIFVGTPGYMAPELFSGAEPALTADLFAAGALGIEMITGTPAFGAENVAEAVRLVLSEQPPTLTGGPAVEAADRVLQRALSKQPEERPASAREFAGDLADVRRLVDGTERPNATSVQRLLVLPFRLRKPDEETEFLAFGLADALNTSLSGLPGLAVLSSQVGARYAEGELDLARIAEETRSKFVLVGTIQRHADRIRVTVQLLEAPNGKVAWSDTTDTEMRDLFELQDELARRLADSLALTLAPGKRLQSDVPANATAYECFLRANQLAFNFGQLEQARDLYRRCLEHDPTYAPAWAQLGRVLRVMAKYGHGDFASNLAEAERAFHKALDLNPALSVAHHLYAYFQIEERGESKEAMLRLLEQARRRPTDAQLLSGLVLACRFCGLLDASIEADRRARRLDPGVRTSVQYSYWAAGDYERALRHDDEDLGWIHYYALPLIGRGDEAVQRCRERERRSLNDVERALLKSNCSALEGDAAECREATDRVLSSNFHDPEGRMFGARNLLHVGEIDTALDVLDSAVAKGLFCDRLLEVDPWMDAARDDPRFAAILADARARRADAEAAYEAAGGAALLGPGLRPRS